MINYKFQPSEQIRAFDGRKFVGVEIVVGLRHTNKDNTDQYVCSEKTPGFDFVLSGWVGKVLGPSDTKITRTIRSCKLIQHANGGRSDTRQFDTYAEYFNDERKTLIFAKRAAGLMGSLQRAGDDEHADLLVGFEDCELDATDWGFVFPEEWVSEVYKDHHTFKFIDGFYETADKAVEIFQKKCSTHIFGPRRFPVLVFPHDVPMQKINDILWRPKTHSDPIITDQYIIYGTRCKPDEYEEVIRMTYEAGGKVPVGVEWDW